MSEIIYINAIIIMEYEKHLQKQSQLKIAKRLGVKGGTLISLEPGQVLIDVYVDTRRPIWRMCGAGLVETSEPIKAIFFSDGTPPVHYSI